VWVLLLLALSGSGSALSPKLPLAGIYSDLTYNAESGDLHGMELFVFPGSGDTIPWRLLFQLAEGDGPLSSLVDLRPVADHFEFLIPAEGAIPEMRFAVRFTAQEALVKNLVGGAEVHVRRGRSYWE
jgi:hypothetical protein